MSVSAPVPDVGAAAAANVSPVSSRFERRRLKLISAELIGVDATLQKPFDINDLLKALKTF